MAQFLNRVTPSILEALDESYGTTAFEDYDPNTNENVLTTTQLMQKINTISDLDSQVLTFHNY